MCVLKEYHNLADVLEDRNFDDIAHKFAKNIYGSEKGDIRQTIVWQDIEQILALLEPSSPALHILDAGGGLGQISQRIALRGHQVALCDLSSKMLKLADHIATDVSTLGENAAAQTGKNRNKRGPEAERNQTVDQSPVAAFKTKPGSQNGVVASCANECETDNK